MDIIKIEKDKQKAESLKKLAALRYKKINLFNVEEDASLICEAYYEVCKELITAILFCDGYKTLSHKTLLEYIKKNYAKLNNDELELLDDLRKRRNKLVYYGIFQPSFYIKKNSNQIEKIIVKLKNILKEKLLS